MEIERLPEELLMEVISRTSPQDACRAAAVSQSLRAAADSDAVWSRFLPRDLPRLAENEIPSAPLSSKGLFQRLVALPALLPGELVSMRLDRATGAKCHTLSARALNISWGDTPYYWRWIHVDVDDYWFSEAAELLHVCWLEIRGRIPSKMLSKNTEYTARIVFKLTDDTRCLDHPFQDASVSVGGSESTRHVCLQARANEDVDAVAAGRLGINSFCHQLVGYLLARLLLGLDTRMAC
ncbi:putative F-box protein PP2-B12 [Brachypodium distachyon]|nr:putative F-box protein PP2-B12 [Brachypodium distachyon]|eukprot:XP_024313926.1 putative F-box protein PP2-B12 [Brachypodium distachyon]